MVPGAPSVVSRAPIGNPREGGTQHPPARPKENLRSRVVCGFSNGAGKTIVLRRTAGLSTSKTRVAIIMRLFLNPGRGAYLRELVSETGIIDLLLVGDIDQRNLIDLVAKTERSIDRKIRTLCLTRNECERMHDRLNQRPQLLLWNAVDLADEARLDADQAVPNAPPATDCPVEDRANG